LIDVDRNARRSETVESLERRLQDLPMLPSVVARLLSLDRSSTELFDEVLGLTAEDPTFALQILKLANAASMSPAEQVRSMPHAITLLGAAQVVSLSISMSVTRVFVPRTQGDRFLWIHSIEVACAAREIARLIGSKEIDPELAYVCGLLHDIGRFILLQELPENLKAVDDSEWGSPEELVAAEQAICGFDHAQLGWRACRAWRIPDVIADVVRLHHRCTGPQADDRVSLRNLRTPHYWEGSSEELEAAALECFHPDWHVPMTTARPLAGRIPAIFAESERLIAHVGLRSGG
jgi:putative nucleotidyltransferase with HDIG domain